MSKQTAKQPAKLNASQKLEALEQMIITQEARILTLADEIDKNRILISSLNKRLNASIRAAESGGLNNESVNKLIVEDNVRELEGKVKFLVDQGALKLENESEIDEKSFVVGRGVDDEGNVVNPRLQFAVNSLDESVKTPLMGRKAGEVIQYSEEEPKIEITEIYKIQNIVKKFEQKPKEQ